MPYTRSVSIAVQVAPEAVRLLEADLGNAMCEGLQTALEAAVQQLLEAEPAPPQGEICFYLTTDSEIRTLNRLYRGVDKATDVLSFGYEPAPPTHDEPVPLGDVIISAETARRQAALNAHDLRTELLMLALHGTLHLMGYDDSTETGRTTMNARAVAVLRALGYDAREEWYSRYENA
ncbi:MAG: rRNA maturation RNase YbeY [Fimbriimonadales bacterium]|nr:rRNA maturation RNase YbeY [Fimbriimonadales bacterium]